MEIKREFESWEIEKVEGWKKLALAIKLRFEWGGGGGTEKGKVCTAYRR
jgi:hypothetical protein